MEEHDLTPVLRACLLCALPAPMDLSKGYRTTLVGFLGPHDPNCLTGTFECANGHRFLATTHYCCRCGWSGAKTCRVSGHDQVMRRKLRIEWSLDAADTLVCYFTGMRHMKAFAYANRVAKRPKRHRARRVNGRLRKKELC